MQAVNEKATSIRLFILDVDGILTSGTIYYGSQGMQMKGFHIQDGLGIQLLQQTGITVAVISGKTSEAVVTRLKELDVLHAYLGCDNKLSAYKDLTQKLSISDHEVAFMGDDLPDLPLLRRVGLAITVPDAPDIIKQHIDFITVRNGGAGAVREACELIMQAQGRYQSVIESYLIT